MEKVGGHCFEGSDEEVTQLDGRSTLILVVLARESLKKKIRGERQERRIVGSSGTGAEHLRGCAKATAGQEGGRTGLVTEASTELNCKNNKPASYGTEEFNTCVRGCASREAPLAVVWACPQRKAWCRPPPGHRSAGRGR